jgi:hypothetical protein
MAGQQARNWLFFVDEQFAEEVCRKAWCKHGKGYLARKEGGRTVYMHSLVWQLSGREAAVELDHANGCPWDNRIENLRPATRRLQALNTRGRSRASGLPRGVNVRSSPRRKNYQATGWDNGKIICLGYYMTAEEASAAHETWRLKAIEEETNDSNDG